MHADHRSSVDARRCGRASHPAVRGDRLRIIRTFCELRSLPASMATPDGPFDLLLFGTAASGDFSVWPQIGERSTSCASLLRRPETAASLVDRRARRRPGGWLISVRSGLRGYFSPFRMSMRLPRARRPRPAHVSRGRPRSCCAARLRFARPAPSDPVAGKINVTNAMPARSPGRLSFSRLTHSIPGRVVLVGASTVMVACYADGVARHTGAWSRRLALYSMSRRLGRRTGRRSRQYNKSLGCPTAHRVQARDLYDLQSGRRRRDVMHHSLDQRFRLFRPRAKPLSAS